MVKISIFITMFVVTLGMVTLITLTSGSLTPVSAQGIPSSLTTEQVNVSREISAPIDKVWNIVSDVDNEAKYWSIIKNIKNINKTDTITEREVIVQAGPGGDAKTHQIVTVNPDHFAVNMSITEGPITGSRVLTLTPENNATTKVDAVWEIDMSGIPLIGQGFAKGSFQKTTEDALGNIAATSEGKK